MNNEFDPVKYDKFCRTNIEKNDTENLFEWLSKSDGIERTLGEFQTQDETEQFALKLQIAGAVNVWAIGIERATEDLSFENSGKLCVLLPENLEKRRELLDIANQIAEEQGFDAVPDKEQNYLFIALD